MKTRGLFRLWIVASAIFVPAVAFWEVNDFINTWERLDKIAIEACVNQEGSPNFNVDKCFGDAGVGKTAFQHEHTTAGAYWSEALGFALVLDLIITAIMFGGYFVARWVIRGFRAEA